LARGRRRRRALRSGKTALDVSFRTGTTSRLSFVALRHQGKERERVRGHDDACSYHSLGETWYVFFASIRCRINRISRDGVEGTITNTNTNTKFKITRAKISYSRKLPQQQLYCCETGYHSCRRSYEPRSPAENDPSFSVFKGPARADISPTSPSKCRTTSIVMILQLSLPSSHRLASR
jgi:hypothetical protein